MKRIRRAAFALLICTPATAATLADLDHHLDQQRGFVRDATAATIGTDAAFCRSKARGDSGRQEDCRQALGGSMAPVRAPARNAPPAGCSDAHASGCEAARGNRD